MSIHCVLGILTYPCQSAPSGTLPKSVPHQLPFRSKEPVSSNDELSASNSISFVE